MLCMNEHVRTALRGKFQGAILDVEAFLRNYRQCTTETCTASCCYSGAVLLDEEKAVISKVMECHSEALGHWLPDLPEAPFEEGHLFGSNAVVSMTKVRPHHHPSEFPSHFDETRCVFADEGGRCGLQRLSLHQGKHPWWYKPLDCWLHPIRLVADPQPLITIPDETNDPYSCEGYPGFTAFTTCGKSVCDGDPGYRVFAQELEMLGLLLERDLIAEIAAVVRKTS